jgi:hypothetical protein
MELKVYCDCGQKYKFDVEPVNGQMPYKVACPICQRDGTVKANELLAQNAVFTPIGSAPAPAAPATPPPPVAPANPPPGPPKLRVSAATEAKAVEAPPAIAPVMEPASPPAGRPRVGSAPIVVGGDPAKKPSFAMGLLGAFLGAMVGAFLYFIIYKTTGVRIFLALGVGGLAGWWANLLSRGEGSKELGGIAAVLTVAAVLAAQYFVALDRWHKVTHSLQDGGYADSVKEAREVVKLVPTGSEGEVRLYLAKHNAGGDDAIRPDSVSSDDVKEFQEKLLPQYRDLASGKITQAQYLATLGLDADKLKKAEDDEGETVKTLFMLITLSRAGIFSIVAGAALAFKLSANA